MRLGGGLGFLLFVAALLELLPAAAGARVVPLNIVLQREEPGLGSLRGQAALQRGLRLDGLEDGQRRTGVDLAVEGAARELAGGRLARRAGGLLRRLHLHAQESADDRL